MTNVVGDEFVKDDFRLVHKNVSGEDLGKDSRGAHKFPPKIKK
jgi:hypothetical protein